MLSHAASSLLQCSERNTLQPAANSCFTYHKPRTRHFHTICMLTFSEKSSNHCTHMQPDTQQELGRWSCIATRKVIERIYAPEESNIITTSSSTPQAPS
jgi:hypothetical protein